MSDLYWPTRRRRSLVINLVFCPRSCRLHFLFPFHLSLWEISVVCSVLSAHRVMAFQSWLCRVIYIYIYIYICVCVCVCVCVYTDISKYTVHNPTAASRWVLCILWVFHCFSNPRSGVEWNDVSSDSCYCWHRKKVETLYNYRWCYVELRIILRLLEALKMCY